ncbi:AaceriAFR427Wp [[Ashbya] aceris (nom. inval.)]|nr:AaceriAFR427Wp [[Ashbya] aceris (nom. inval.)]
MATIVLPLVSAGNVPQLCADVLLHSMPGEFRFERELEWQWLHPFVGPLDYVEGQKSLLYRDTPEKRVTTPLELFYCEKRRLYVVQQRSPVIQGYENEFCKEVLLPLLEELAPERVLVLDSVGEFETEVPVHTETMESRFSVATCNVTSISDVAKEFAEGLQLDEQNDLSVNSTLFSFKKGSFQRGISTEQFIYKFSYHLLHSPLARSPGFAELSYVSIFIHEGDNNEDALLLCKELPTFVPFFPRLETFLTPISWKGVYGSKQIPDGYDEGLYI